MQVKLCSRIFTEITQQMKGKTGGLIILKRSYLHFDFFMVSVSCLNL